MVAWGTSLLVLFLLVYYCGMNNIFLIFSTFFSLEEKSKYLTIMIIDIHPINRKHGFIFIIIIIISISIIIRAPSCRSCIHVFNRIEAPPVCKWAGASEGDEPDDFFGFRQTFLLDQENGAFARKWHCEVKRPRLGSPEENSRAWVLHGKGQGN